MGLFKKPMIRFEGVVFSPYQINKLLKGFGYDEVEDAPVYKIIINDHDDFLFLSFDFYDEALRDQKLEQLEEIVGPFLVIVSEPNDPKYLLWLKEMQESKNRVKSNSKKNNHDLDDE